MKNLKLDILSEVSGGASGLKSFFLQKKNMTTWHYAKISTSDYKSKFHEQLHKKSQDEEYVKNQNPMRQTIDVLLATGTLPKY